MMPSQIAPFIRILPLILCAFVLAVGSNALGLASSVSPVTVAPTALSFGSSLDSLNLSITTNKTVQQWSVWPQGDGVSDALIWIGPYGGFAAQPNWTTGNSTIVVNRKSLSEGTATIVVQSIYTDQTSSMQLVPVTLSPAQPIPEPVPLIPIYPAPTSYTGNGYCGGMQVNGDPYPPCGTVWVLPQTSTLNTANIVGLHYKARVVQNDPPVPPPAANANGVSPAQFNLVFSFFHFQTPGSTTPGRGFMSQISAGRGGVPPNLACGQNSPIGYDAESSFTFAVTDDLPDINHHELGVRSLSKNTFPTQTFLMDYTANLWQVNGQYQGNTNYTDVAIEVTRAGTTRNANVMLCPEWVAPTDTYRIWDAKGTVSVNGGTPVVNEMLFYFPDSTSSYFQPDKPIEIVTENFANTSNAFKVLYWGIEILNEGSTTWVPISNWFDAVDDKNASIPNGYGARVIQLNGQTYLEFSHDGTPTYLTQGATFTL